ncbi:Rpn family recombination-promoting nuclease/putative transposase [Mycoavidus sp. SF9855]|uniref:Rpn family recombination-promoting nuclease/putative transposase n=1 Tax=Mycoavidus sp. SF9855 TaxID=2968475 RepID=UPI00211BBC10|nr:Rpn family recombination-promoting nuclease/putative transposase [Mycoavidus sp. SF9855]UUM22161.1 Rpn family recombination-promoting nuclease/putative transposase [Mycoavidus sp. SF9855]
MKHTLSTPHDALFKTFLTNITVAKDFLHFHLPAHLKKYCDLSTLEIVAGSFVDAELRQHFSDIVYSMRIANTPGYIYTLIEHESTAGKLTPFKLLRYQVGLMKQHLDQNNALLPVIVPILFYRGLQSPYPGPVDLFDCFENKALAQKIFLKPIKLIDLSMIPNEELKTHKSIAALELIQKHIRARDLMQFAKPVIELMTAAPLTHELVRSVLHYLLREGKVCDDNYAQFIELVVENAPSYREEIMTIAQQLELKGRQEGERLTILAIAKNLLNAGSAPDFIKKITNLSDQDIATL